MTLFRTLFVSRSRPSWLSMSCRQAGRSSDGISARVICPFARMPRWQTNELLKGDLYWRDGVKRRLPAPAQKVVDGVRVLFADARFAVSFVGHDPVLHVFLNGRSYNALVWDVNTDGTIEILLPPPTELGLR